jgi:hypothetical protein
MIVPFTVLVTVYSLVSVIWTFVLWSHRVILSVSTNGLRYSRVIALILRKFSRAVYHIAQACECNMI